ncbi:unnamed protein product [Clonostachys rosea]|uniref:Uncharacterized protein n=1 Tax=Bionectria ochroleuca TaxID=29856 RepID=A0ABY6TN65_BIOOC|nr:unnamed protein product [Clonostachys rosea]
MLRLHPTTLTITAAELRELDRRYAQRNQLKNSPRQNANTHCTEASPPGADDDESTDVNDIPTPASSTPSQVSIAQASPTLIQWSNVIACVEEEEEEADGEDEDNAAFSDMADLESALDLTPRAKSSSSKTRHFARNHSTPRPPDLPPPFSQTPRSRVISSTMTINQGDHLQDSPPLPSRDIGGGQEDMDG